MRVNWTYLGNDDSDSGDCWVVMVDDEGALHVSPPFNGPNMYVTHLSGSYLTVRSF